jgi:hypothetical protein
MDVLPSLAGVLNPGVFTVSYRRGCSNPRNRLTKRDQGNFMNIAWLPLLVAGMLTGISAISNASSHPQPEQVRAWVESGAILPLEQILHQQPIPGRILDAELEWENRVLIYEIKWMDDNGRRHKFCLDAATAIRQDCKHGKGRQNDRTIPPNNCEREQHRHREQQP